MAARRKNTTQANGPHSATHTAAPPPPAPTAGLSPGQQLVSQLRTDQRRRGRR